ncbi:MAG: hypothetical protein Q7T18_01340 [Sedimentisphaerales bacterium]|nr:hypothetical protein [Sedimentisphaerales bacterium]
MSQTDEEKNQLELELAAAKSQAEELAGQVVGLSTENTLIAKLVSAGASDIEAAVLLAKTRVGKDNDIDGVVAQLKKEKPHLFGQIANSPSTFGGCHPGRAAQKTAGAKDTAAGATSALERAARKASGSAHSRASVQEYMRVRRKF